MEGVQQGGKSSACLSITHKLHANFDPDLNFTQSLQTAGRRFTEYPSWGAPKIREKILRKHPDAKCPAISTIHAVLDRHGLVKSDLRLKRYKAEGTPLVHLQEPNDLWCADYKGEFMLGDQRYCYPLTITDYASRSILSCEALSSTKEEFAFEVFTRAFKDYGLPKAIRTDNGVPFSSANALYGLTRLSVWWLRLGIGIERIRPGNPQENGRHERMHLTLKKETTRPPGENQLKQQEKFDDFIRIFNFERPHQALQMKYPSEVFKKSEREYKGIEPIFYPFHDKTIQVTQCGRICQKNWKVNLSRAFAGQEVGVKEVEDGIWMVTFLDYDLGYFDEAGKRVEPVDRFLPKYELAPKMTTPYMYISRASKLLIKQSISRFGDSSCGSSSKIP